MAVETMKMMGFIGKNELMNKILRQLVLDGSLHAVNALVRINSIDFKILPTEKNIEALEELPFLKSYSAHRDFSEDEKIITGLIKYIRTCQTLKTIIFLITIQCSFQVRNVKDVDCHGVLQQIDLTLKISHSIHFLLVK